MGSKEALNSLLFNAFGMPNQKKSRMNLSDSFWILLEIPEAD